MLVYASLHVRLKSSRHLHSTCVQYRRSAVACHCQPSLTSSMCQTRCTHGELQRYAKHRPYPIFSLAAWVIGGAPVGAVLARVVAVQGNAAAYSHSSQVVDWPAIMWLC